MSCPRWLWILWWDLLSFSRLLEFLSPPSRLQDQRERKKAQTSAKLSYVWKCRKTKNPSKRKPISCIFKIEIEKKKKGQNLLSLVIFYKFISYRKENLSTKQREPWERVLIQTHWHHNRIVQATASSPRSPIHPPILKKNT